ncbi:MAG: hypothetical protein AAGM38_09210 [Pseudomonadota bacterium]
MTLGTQNSTLSASLTWRIGVGKLIGLLIGAGAFALIGAYAPQSPEALRWGALFWFLTLGAVIGMAGLYTAHPVLRVPLPWWVRAPFIGAWMHLVLGLIAAAPLTALSGAAAGAEMSAFAAILWFVAIGAVSAFVIDAGATAIGG